MEFREAVRRSKKLIASGLTPEMAAHASGQFMATTLGASMLRNKPDELLAWAKSNADGFDALCLGVAHAVERGFDEELTQEIRKWLAGILRGEVQRPKARAGRGSGGWLHHLIWIAVSSRVGDGMSATRNDASEPTSACDAVAEALAELGLEPATFHGVKRVWLRHEQRKGTTIQAT